MLVSDLPDAFSEFFQQKIIRIHTQLDVADAATIIPMHHVSRSLVAFSVVTKPDVQKIVHRPPTKSCLLDPIPTSLLKERAVNLTPVITNIVSSSLQRGVFPHEFKRAIVTPLLKSTSLDPDTFTNFGPVSNLHFASKIV